MTTERDAAKAKVAKLFAMADHARSNANEAETAMRQAAALMRRHNIEQAEILAASGNAPAYRWNTVLVPADPCRPVATAITWVGILGLAVGRLTDCIVGWRRNEKHGMCLTFSGEATDVEYAVWLAKMLRDTVRIESARFQGTRGQCGTFRMSMVARLADRMKELKRSEDAELNQAQTSAGTALAIVNDKRALCAAQFGKQTHRSHRHGGDSRATDAGRSAGDRVQINRPLGQARAAIGGR